MKMNRGFLAGNNLDIYPFDHEHKIMTYKLSARELGEPLFVNPKVYMQRANPSRIPTISFRGHAGKCLKHAMARGIEAPQSPINSYKHDNRNLPNWRAEVGDDPRRSRMILS